MPGDKSRSFYLWKKFSNIWKKHGESFDADIAAVVGISRDSAHAHLSDFASRGVIIKEEAALL
jgi:predicted ArsR family transcriptional regulator